LLRSGSVVTRPDLAALASQAEAEMRAAGSEERAVREKAYLKSSIEHAGTSVPSIRAVAGRIRREYPDFDAATVFALADELWRVPLHERRMVAVVILQRYADAMTPRAVARLESFLRQSHTWALVDGLAGDVAARIVLRHPDDPVVDAVLRRWGDDEDFWLRRSALLAHLHTVGRRGRFIGWERFTSLADSMLDEREFFVRKAIGWVLREAGKHRSGLVVDFLWPRITRISGVTIGEAVRYLEPADRDVLVSAYRAR
jgi:3-methyladenine DNA glycosylase AlkD